MTGVPGKPGVAIAGVAVTPITRFVFLLSSRR
jgi:hypothetical protein